ncbi:MAG TPA: hypothetical protein VHT27_08080 [Solirubrobacteraceae bacterium]|nr:hypothetical protein [Solirubrobacteraceae bacterium]
MSNSELIEYLRRSNPVVSDPPAPAIAQLLPRLDQTARSFGDAVAPPTSRAPRATRVRIAVACAAAVLAVVVFAVLGSSGGGTPNVLADVYRALSPGSGVLHMVEVTEQTVAGKTSTTREEIWTAQSPRRLRSITTPADGKTYEMAFASSPLEDRRWSEEEPNVILHGTPAGALTHEASPVSVLRELVRKGEMTVAGKTTLEGRAVWQLTVHPSNYTQPAFDGKQLPDPTMYVDAVTFAPVELVSESLTHANGQISGALELETATTRYETYEEAPKDAHSESFLKLAEHPGAVEKNEP